MSDWEPFNTMENGVESNTENSVENPEDAAVTKGNPSSIDAVAQKTAEDTYRAESTEAIYNTPSTEHTPAGDNNTHGVFSGIPQENSHGTARTWQEQPVNDRVYESGQAVNSQSYETKQVESGQAYQTEQAENGQPYGNGQWQGQPGNGQPYGNGQWQGQPGNGQPYGVPGNNPYSPYAVPQKKSHTGLIVGIIVAVIVLFLAAFIALVSKIAQAIKEEKAHSYQEESYYSDEDYNFDYYDDNHYYDDNDDNAYRYDDDDEIDEGYTYDDDYDYDSDEYYTLHDDLKDNLSYSVDFDYIEYDSVNENVYIVMGYPIITGKDVPNLDKLNETLASEIDQYIEYYEDTYQQYMTDEDDIFYAYINAYVTYMDEEKLSIVYNETVYGDYTEQVYLECVNIDMENGIILDNTQMLSIDDDFSVEFRQKSDIQNGANSYLDSLTDQEITEYFKSRHIIVFYVPQGMEIGFNYEEGWVTVTYADYEQYLKSF